MKRISFNRDWQFAKIPDDVYPVPASSAQWQTVTLPHSPYTDEEQYHGLMVYRKSFPADPAWECVYLELEGADQVCRAYANGLLLGEHRGGYARFRFALPAQALQSGEVCVELILDNSLNPEVSPNFGDFTVFGGLYRNVNLLIAAKDRFDYGYYGTDGVLAWAELDENGDGLVRAEAHVCTADETARVRYTLLAPDGEIAAACESGAGERAQLRAAKPRLWNGRKGASFYTLRAQLLANGAECDETSLRLGFRRIEMSADEGLRLNGERVKLHGVAKHQDRAGVFSAVTAEQIDEDFRLIREIGANAVRLSHYQHAQHTYDRCDEEGHLVWAEIPMLKMTENPALMENAKEQLRELILQNLHHPSVFCWGIQNEIAMFRDAPFMHTGCRELYELAKALDPTRLVTAANLYNVKFESPLNAVTDMVGYNIYFGWYYGEMPDYSAYLDHLHAARPELPVGVSEYGADGNPALHAQRAKVKDYSEEYQALFHETVYPILASKDYLWGSFVWNMFDFSSDRRNEGGVKYLNAKGLVSHDRSLRKDAFYYYKAVWSKEPFVHLCSSRFVRRAQEQIPVKVYTNLPTVSLWLNGVRIAEAANNGNGTVLFPSVPLQPGENLVRAVAGVCEDACVFERVETEEESYKLPQQAEGPVRNWFLSDDDTVKEGYYSVMDTVQDILDGPGTYKVVARYAARLASVLDTGVVPLQLALKDVLGRELKDPDAVRKINDALHEIKKAL